ncbi:hypothetical protein Tcan_00933, partial [Toxocara canis]
MFGSKDDHQVLPAFSCPNVMINSYCERRKTYPSRRVATLEVDRHRNSRRFAKIEFYLGSKGSISIPFRTAVFRVVQWSRSEWQAFNIIKSQTLKSSCYLR